MKPERVYILLPAHPVESLTPCDIHPLLEVEEALRHARICKPATPSLHSSVRVSASPGFKVTLLFDTVLQSVHVKRYKTLFQPQETLSGHAGASVILSRIEGINTGHSRWSGSLTLPDDTAQPNGGEGPPPLQHQQHQIRPEVKRTNAGSKTIEFPGFHLVCNPGAKVPPLLTRKACSGHVLSFAPCIPDLAAFHTARSGLQLRLSQSCPARTVSLFNELAKSGNGMLLAIGDAKFWCFWTPKTATENVICHALYLSPLSRYSATSLDTAAWTLRMQLDDHLDVQNLPHSISSLPVKNFFSHYTPPVFEQLYDMDCPPLEDAIAQLSSSEDDLLSGGVKHCKPRIEQANGNEIIDIDNPENNIKNSNGNNAVVVLDDQVDDEATTVAMTPSLDFKDDISGPELQALDRRERGRQALASLGTTANPKTAGPGNARSDSCSMLDSRSLTGKRSGASGRESQRAYRQLRFQRLMNNSRTQTDKRAADGGGASGHGQRAKRARTSDAELGGKLGSNSVGDSVGSGVGIGSKGLGHGNMGTARRRNSKGMRQSSQILFLQNMRSSFHSLKSEEPFFSKAATFKSGNEYNLRHRRRRQQRGQQNGTVTDDEYDANDDDLYDNDTGEHTAQNAPNITTLGLNLCADEFDDEANDFRFTADWVDQTRRLQGHHGVEYLFDNDNRDRHIVEFENLVKSSALEFSTAHLSSEDSAKLSKAVDALSPNRRDRALDCRVDVRAQRPVTTSRPPPPALSSERILLTQLAEGLRCGKVIINDLDLQKRLLQTASVTHS